MSIESGGMTFPVSGETIHISSSQLNSIMNKHPVQGLPSKLADNIRKFRVRLEGYDEDRLIITTEVDGTSFSVHTHLQSCSQINDDVVFGKILDYKAISDLTSEFNANKRHGHKLIMSYCLFDTIKLNMIEFSKMILRGCVVTSLEFNHCNFDDDVVFEKNIVGERLKFSRCVMDGAVLLVDNEMGNDLELSEAIVHYSVIMRGNIVHGNLDLSNSDFKGSVEVSDNRKAFLGRMFKVDGKAVFNSAVFHKTTVFKSFQLCGGAKFDSTVFHSSVSFLQGRNGDDVAECVIKDGHFQNTKFNGPVHFSMTVL